MHRLYVNSIIGDCMPKLKTQGFVILSKNQKHPSFDELNGLRFEKLTDHEKSNVNVNQISRALF